MSKYALLEKSISKRDVRFGFVESKVPNTLSFATDAHNLGIALANENIRWLIVPWELPVGNTHKTMIFRDSHPKFKFIELCNSSPLTPKFPSQIDETVVVKEMSLISDFGVVIGKNTIVGRHVVIGEGVKIGDGCVIGDHVTLGNDSIYSEHNTKNFITLIHQGSVNIGPRVYIGSYTSIDRSLFYGESTNIGSDNLIGAYCSFSHGVEVGNHNFFANNVLVAGYTRIENLNWFGPGVSTTHRLSIGSSNRISIGSIIYRNIGSFQNIVSGRVAPKPNVSF